MIYDRPWTWRSLTSHQNQTERCNPRIGERGGKLHRNLISGTFLHRLTVAPDRRLIKHCSQSTAVLERDRRHRENLTCVPPIHEFRKTRGKDVQPAWTQGVLVLPPDKHAMATQGGDRGGVSGWFIIYNPRALHRRSDNRQ